MAIIEVCICSEGENELKRIAFKKAVIVGWKMFRNEGFILAVLGIVIIEFLTYGWLFGLIIGILLELLEKIINIKEKEKTIN